MTKLDKLFDDIAEKEFGAEVDREIEKAQKKKTESLNEEANLYLENVKNKNDDFVCKQYRRYMNIDENFKITEDNIRETILQRVANENYYSVDKLRKLLLNKKEN